MKKGIFTAIVGCILVFLFFLFIQSSVNKPAVSTSSDLHIYGVVTEDSSTGEHKDSSDPITPSGTSVAVKVWVLEDFNNIQLGVSTIEDLKQYNPFLVSFKRNHRDVIRFELADGRVVEFECESGVVKDMHILG